jgi:hypothetical protein
LPPTSGEADMAEKITSEKQAKRVQERQWQCWLRFANG